MEQSTYNQINRSISNYKRGKIFFPSSFAKFGPSTAVRKTLERLENKGVLIRLAKGIYLYPKVDKLLGVILPPIEEIVNAISKRDKARIIPTGIEALNLLGLSTQIPMKAVYLTDGSARTIKVGNRSVKLKRASPKILAVKGEINLLVIQALKEIGEKNLDEKALQKIKQVLQEVDPEVIEHDMNLAPAWITKIMREILKEIKNERVV